MDIPQRTAIANKLKSRTVPPYQWLLQAQSDEFVTPGRPGFEYAFCFLNWTCIWAFYWHGVYTRCSPTPLQANAPHAWHKVHGPCVFAFVPGYFEGGKASELPERRGKIRHIQKTYISRVNREPALTSKVPLTLQSKRCTDGATFVLPAWVRASLHQFIQP